MNKLLRVVTAVGIASCLTSSATAQERANLRVLVEDHLNSGIPGATVVLVSSASAATRQATSDAEGRVTFEGLGPGDYVIKAEMSGFLTLSKSVTIGTASQSVKLKLQIGLTAEVSVK